MKKLRQLCAGTVLMLVFAVAVFAGDIDCPGITSQPATTGEIECPGLQLAVIFLQGALSLV
jgi:hypothetical protein